MRRGGVVFGRGLLAAAVLGACAEPSLPEQLEGIWEGRFEGPSGAGTRYQLVVLGDGQVSITALRLDRTGDETGEVERKWGRIQGTFIAFPGQDGRDRLLELKPRGKVLRIERVGDGREVSLRRRP